MFSHNGLIGGGGGTIPAAAIWGVNSLEKSNRRRLTERTMEIANVASMNETKVIYRKVKALNFCMRVVTGFRTHENVSVAVRELNACGIRYGSTRCEELLTSQHLQIRKL